VKKFLASLLNEPWLIEEAWLEMMVQNFVKEDLIQDPESLKIMKSQKLAGSRTAGIRGDIAHIPIHGPIFARPNFLTEWLGIGCILTTITGDIQTAIDDPDVESIVLDIDSPGGTVTGINEASNFIKTAGKEKDITAYVGGVGASAAYWLASAAKEIVLDATSRVGSIGVVVAYPLPQKDDDGYVELVNTASPAKRPDISTKEGKKVITAELDDLADVFISTVAINRDVSVDTVKSDFGKGGVLVGQKAISAGMADRLGSFEELMTENNNVKGETSMLTIDKLKADHKETYDQLVASVTTEVTAGLQTANEGVLAVKDTEITDLKAKLAASETKTEGMETRVKALEKRDVLRDEEANKAQAASIMDAAILVSSIPERLHAKVTRVDYNAHMTDGKLDVAGFTAAVSAEVKDWEDSVGAIAPIQGPGGLLKSETIDSDAEADDESVDRMLSYVQTKKEA